MQQFAPLQTNLFGQSSPASFSAHPKFRAVVANEGTMSTNFAIEGKSNIPSDNSSHKVSIAVRRITPTTTVQIKNCHSEQVSVSFFRS